MKRIIFLFTFLAFLVPAKNSAQLVFSANQEYGQIYDVLYDTLHEGTVYARTVGNHIIKSTNNGLVWSILYSDPMEEYCTLSQMRLINEGMNLSFIVNAEGTAYNKVVLINPNDGSVSKEFDAPNPFESDILIASYDIFEDNNIAVIHTSFTVNYGFTNEIFRTEDGGSTWESIYYSPDNGNIAVNNVAISPENPERLFIMRGGSPENDFGGLLISQDGGSSWEEKIPGNTYSAIAFNPDNAQDIFVGTFYGYGSHLENLYRSVDGGKNWNIVPITWTSMASDHINHIAFDPENTNTIVVLEENEIVISHDNGSTWENYVYNEINPEQYYYGLNISFNPFVPDEWIISANFYPFRSMDAGVNLEKLQNPFVNSTGRIDSHFKDNGNHLYYGLRNGFIHRDIDANLETGHRMRSLNNTFGVTTFPFADKEIAGRIFTSGRFGMNSLVEMSLDHGENYYLLYGSSSFLNIYELATSPANPNEIWFSFGDSAFMIDVADPTIPLVKEIDLPTFDLLYGLVVDPSDPKRVTISQGTQVYYSVDGGLNWSNSSLGLEVLDPLQDMILKIALNPFNPQEYALASTKGIFISDDQGQSWNQVFEEFVENISFSSIVDGHLVATNHYSDGYLFPKSSSRIVFSEDKGENWQVVSGETLRYINSSSSTYRFFEDKAEIFFGTFDTGLVSYTIDFSGLGVGDFLTKERDFVLFPNPTTSFVNVGGDIDNLQRVSVFSPTGQLVLEETENPKQIDISGFSEGVYLFKIESSKNVSFKRVIKKTY